MKIFFTLLLMILALAQPGQAQELSALAKLQPEGSQIEDSGSGLVIVLAISQPVPWRVRVLDNPARLLVDFREVDWAGLANMPVDSEKLLEMRAGVFRPGWSRLVLELAQPMLVSQSEMRTDGATVVELRLEPALPEVFAAAASLAEPADWALPKAVTFPKPQPRGAGPLKVVLDPGHGGLDPGAESDGQSEARLMLKFARELKELLLRDGNFEVVMTRDSDVFVPLETRISIARAAGADVFLSLHADALAEGEAAGATVYTLAAEASDAASATLAERHDRDDLLAGVDLTQADDLVAEVLLDMARTQTTPRTERLAAAMTKAIKAQGLKMHRHPQQKASFSVLKSADIPSVLLELGFLSSENDLKRLNDAEWRAKMAVALRDAFKLWDREDASLRALPVK
ncbi:MAG: N-acetylmuramoyl-L-alanine amidase [Rhodobacteraceae bacterium]|uniref:N-acetylmuramoyl-L-alanine amidase n=1 Tax=Cypionkella sp. TaxID=2811411 RepID=UPI001322E971|nr:N-acetylmuramoyl-L-alanine amidase [Cypionkella sp.]KAF0171331.1 MAG: N-acetylmuramoyl-L-alanine amidase [Paracoccaceae bacterium]MDO8327028.1 N-acetylmuramoyl-L-alanine amidase [Cypionkella sp.]